MADFTLPTDNLNVADRVESIAGISFDGSCISIVNYTEKELEREKQIHIGIQKLWKRYVNDKGVSKKSSQVTTENSKETGGT